MIKERIIKNKVNPKLNQGNVYRVTKSHKNTDFIEGVYFIITMKFSPTYSSDFITTLRSENNKGSIVCDYEYFNNLDLEYIEVNLTEVDE